jgi:pimeloyl-ACP methyl ester carboxylesterase
MGGFVREWGLRRASRVLVWLAAKEPLTAAAELGIRSEALWRRLLSMEVDAITRALGIQTRAAHRRWQEQADGAYLRGSVIKTSASSHWHPAVNWHEGGTGQPLLLLNGWTASGLTWPTSWLRRLESGFRVIRIDNRGTGWSHNAPAPFTIADMADDARDVLRACGVDQAVVLGTSMGGMIAQELALRHPGYVGKLILVATTPPAPARVASDYPVLGLLSKPAPGQDLREYFGRLGQFAAQGFAEAHPDILDEFVAQMMRRVTPRPMVLSQARAIWAWCGARRLSHLSVPTTVVQGDRDVLVRPKNGIWLSRHIPGATYEELSGVGHLVAQEAGDELLRVLGA